MTQINLNRMKSLVAAMSFVLLANSSGHCATVNVGTTATVSDGFKLQGSDSVALATGSLVKLGVFVNTTTGAALAGSDITSLFDVNRAFGLNVSALLGSFIQIGEAKIGYGLANGQYAEGAGVLASIGAEQDYLDSAAPFQFTDSFGDGVFIRNWVDNSLSLQTSNVGSFPFNSVANTKLSGLQLALIAFNGASVGGSTELIVARNTVSTEVLPGAEGDSATFAVNSVSELLVGSAVGSTAFNALSSIPEPTHLSLLGLTILAAIRRRVSHSKAKV
jgi:hypothetical protein